MQAWESFLGALQAKLGEKVVSTWLRPLKVAHFDACNLYLEAETSFQIDWFEEHIRPLAKKSFLNNNFHAIKIHLTCASITSPSSFQKKEKVASFPVQPFVLSKDSILPEYTVENFIFSQENAIIFQVFSQLTGSFESSFSPIFFYGESCSGKTHFLQALTQELEKKNQCVLYVTIETFTENVVRAIRSGTMQEFRKAHRNIDVLIVDDIQHLAKKLATQEEFFHTFNALHSAGKQIILAANVKPSLLTEIEPRLISRFEWGLCLPLLKLAKQDLLKMCQNRCDWLGLSIPLSALEFILESFEQKPKSIQKALEALYMRTAQKNQTLSIPKIQSLLDDLISAEKKERLSPDKIVLHVANFYNITAKDILGKSQTQECSVPRQMAMFLCRSFLHIPYTKIGEIFSRDHSTVISSIKNIEAKLASKDRETLEALEVCKQKMAISSS